MIKVTDAIVIMIADIKYNPRMLKRVSGSHCEFVCFSRHSSYLE